MSSWFNLYSFLSSFLRQTVVKKDPAPETVDEQQQLPEADVEEVEFQDEEVGSVQQQHPVVHHNDARRYSTTTTFRHPMPPKQVEIDVISQSSSTAGFDNVAFEGIRPYLSTADSVGRGFEIPVMGFSYVCVWICTGSCSGKGYSPSPVRVLGTDSFQPIDNDNRTKNNLAVSNNFPQSPLPLAEETIEIFRYDRIPKE